MNTSKLNLSCLFLILVSLTLASSNTTANPSLNQFVEISPSAFDVMVHAFDQLVVLFHDGYDDTVLNSSLQRLDKLKLKINEVYPKDHTLFGYVNLSSDYKNSLEKYSFKTGLHILNKYQVSDNVGDFDQIQVILQLYQEISHPQLPLTYHKDVKTLSKFDQYVVFTFKTVDKLNEYNQMYKRILHFLQELQLSAFAVPSEHNKKQSIQLYHLSQSIKEYRLDQNSTIAQRANQILQQLNIDTLPVVTHLDQTNIHRVFGGEISEQILLIRKNSIPLQELQEVRQMFKTAANYNKNQQLAYERVLFSQVNSTFYDEQFNQQSNLLFRDQSGKEWNYVIMFTRTDYDKFNLKRYIYNNTQAGATAESVIKFIEDVRMKRLEPKYKSQEVPSEAENNGVLRKIVGSSFISEVYEKPDQSIVILFIDSKDEASYKQIQKQFQNFAHKYRYTFDKKLVFGIFDLDKNEHKLLYLKEAPQIVLFDKANKKQTKYYRMNKGVSEQLLKDWVNAEVSNVKVIESLDL